MSKDKDSDKYFSMSEALDDLKFGDGAKNKALSGLKLLGKGLFNTAKYAVTEALPAAVEGAAKAAELTAKTNLKQSEKLLNDDSLSDEKRSRVEEIREKAVDDLKVLEARQNDKKESKKE